jgi:hypothetical protein
LTKVPVPSNVLARKHSGGVMALTEVADKTETATVVHMDNKRFVRCKFTNCTLRYTGSQCEWDANTSFVQCSWKFEDAARRTTEIFMLGINTGDFTFGRRDFSTGK